MHWPNALRKLEILKGEYKEDSDGLLPAGITLQRLLRRCWRESRKLASKKSINTSKRGCKGQLKKGTCTDDVRIIHRADKTKTVDCGKVKT